MTAKESKAVASVGCLHCGGDGIDPVPLIYQQCCGRGVGGECCGEPDQEIEPQPCEQCNGAGKLATESALHDAEAERDAFRKELLLMEHKVITCGVAASHPDKLLTTHGAYKTKWDSPQAQSVRELRDAKDAAEAELGELRRRVGELAGRLGNFGFTLTESRQEQLLFLIAELKLLASDGGADGVCNHEWAEGYGVPAYCQHCGVTK